MPPRAASTRTARRPPLPPGFNPLRSIELAAGFRDKVPDIIEFCVSDQFLNRPNLYPRQATLLKVMFLQDEILTQYDYDVIGEWESTYERTRDDDGFGNNGIVPGVLDRIEINKAAGRPWFRETLNVSGRRGSKGHIGGQAGSYVLWNYLSWGDPQGHFGVDRDKQMACIVFAGKKEQARDNQWRDLTNVITGAPCFTPYISKALGESLTVFAPYDYVRMYERWERGVQVEGDQATFLIVPKESTVMASRGPAAFAQMYDEMAHVVATGANRSAGEVYESAVPALDQFKTWGWLYEPSSPWQKTGQFYENYKNALAMEDGVPVYPEMLMIQLASWDIYRDWERSGDIAIYPGAKNRNRTYIHLRNAIQEYDDAMRRLERANPATFKVERRAHFATVMDAYLAEERVKQMWQPVGDQVFEPQTRGRLDVTYRAHGDPSKSGAGFGYALAHVGWYDEDGHPHVVFDKIHSWEPTDFEGNEIDYAAIQKDIEGDIDAFYPGEVTFDQFNSVATIQGLRKHIREVPRPKQTVVYERTATAPLNWRTYETFKTALGMGLVHGPYHEKADLELRFLQDLGGKVDHPTSGPVQTKDIADCIAIVTYELIGEHVSAFIGETLGQAKMGVAVPGGMPTAVQAANEQSTMSSLSGFGRSRARGMRSRG